MRRHLCVVVEGDGVGEIERCRRAWDPGMAGVVPAHVTVAYPEETTDEELLVRRVEGLRGDVGPFRLAFGDVIADREGHGGVFVAVHDLDGGLADVRRRVLEPPMRAVHVGPHVTIAHPRTSTQGPQCYAELRGHRFAGAVVVRELLFTETTQDSFTILRRFALTGR